MKTFVIVFGVLAILFLAVTISACGGSSGCTDLCLDVRQKLIEQMPQSYHTLQKTFCLELMQLQTAK